MDTLETKTKTPARTKACPPKRRGSGLIFAVVLLFVILGMVITLASVTMLETKMNQKTKSSVGAFYNSESGVEWALNKISISSGTISGTLSANPDGSVSCPISPDCKVYFLKSDGTVITKTDFSTLTFNDIKAVRSVGSQGGETQRAIEAAVASGGGGIYTNWGFNTCVGSDTKIYDGEAIFPADGNGKGGVICLNGHLASFPSVTASGTYWQNGKENIPAGSGAYDWVIIKCAVCGR